MPTCIGPGLSGRRWHDGPVVSHHDATLGTRGREGDSGDGPVARGQVTHFPVMSTPTQVTRSRSVLRTLGAAAAAAAHLAVGYVYLASGLVAPFWAVLALLAWWCVLAAAGVVLWRRRSYVVLLVPVVALLTWIALLWFGGEVLGWTA